MKKLSKLLMITLVMSILFILTSCFTDNTVKEYTVTFETDGGTAIANQSVRDGQTATRPTDPTKSGYTFGGWYEEDTFTTEFDFTTPITADTTIYAKFTA